MRAKSRRSPPTTTPTSSSPPSLLAAGDCIAPSRPTGLRGSVPKWFISCRNAEPSLAVSLSFFSPLFLFTPSSVVFFLDAPFSLQLDPPTDRAAFTSGPTERRVPTQWPSRPRNSGNSNEEGYFAQSSMSEDFHEIPVSGCIRALLSPPSVRLVTSYVAISLLAPSVVEAIYALLFDCVSHEARYTHLLARLRGIMNCRSVAIIPLSRARYRNNSVCQVARKYTQRLYDRDEIRFEKPSPSHLRRAFPAALRVNNISRRFAKPEAPSDRSFTSIQSRFLRAALQVERERESSLKEFQNAVFFSVLRLKIAASNRYKPLSEKNYPIKRMTVLTNSIFLADFLQCTALFVDRFCSFIKNLLYCINCVILLQMRINSPWHCSDSIFINAIWNSCKGEIRINVKHAGKNDVWRVVVCGQISRRSRIYVFSSRRTFVVIMSLVFYKYYLKFYFVKHLEGPWPRKHLRWRIYKIAPRGDFKNDAPLLLSR